MIIIFVIINWAATQENRQHHIILDAVLVINK